VSARLLVLHNVQGERGPERVRSTEGLGSAVTLENETMMTLSTQELPRKLLDVACRIRVGETLFRDDEIVDQSAHALREALDDYESACKAVAQMHFAATGSTDGPRLGVVEDVAALRNEREVLARWMAEALGVLFSVAEEDEDGGESLRLLRERGECLMRAVLLPTQKAALQRMADDAQALGLGY
jgi:hypothetical protein